MPQASSTLPDPTPEPGVIEPGTLDALAAQVVARRAILFVGAGASMAVGLPSWNRLIERMCHELGLDPARFALPDSYPALAEYYCIHVGNVGPLAEWMRSEWRVSKAAIAASEIHRLIVRLDFPTIYTTNYDANLEQAYELHGRPYNLVRNASDLAATQNGWTEIIKFHGDLEDPASLVLTESDYFSRLHFDSPLDVKFSADALGRSILFLGYSMSDMNIRLMLFRLWEIWRRSGTAGARPASYLFSSRDDPVQKALLERRGIRMLSDTSEDPQAALTSFLRALTEKVSALRGRQDADPA